MDTATVVEEVGMGEVGMEEEVEEDTGEEEEDTAVAHMEEEGEISTLCICRNRILVS